MKCCGKCPFILLGAVLAALLVVVGCGKDEKKDGGGADHKGSDNKGGAEPTPAGAGGEVVGKGTGTLKGKVTFAGDPPKLADLKPKIEDQGDKEHCLKGPTNDPTWMIGPGKGVMNVVVWLRPARKGSYFKLADEQKVRKDVVTIDQPFCAFVPHVVAVYPSYFDGKAEKSTGETFKILNSAPIKHNTAWIGDTLFNSGKNEILPSKDQMVVDAKPSNGKKPGEDRINIRCDIHKWMTAYAWVFDHPFFAVTKEDGSYEIKGVPTGVEVELVHWHESFAKPMAKKVTLKDGDNTENFEIKK